MHHVTHVINSVEYVQLHSHKIYNKKKKGAGRTVTENLYSEIGDTERRDTGFLFSKNTHLI